ncbi:RagB/SusD family nutrient uptake outer membrane protein [Empedobacter falsenii]|uniref:RagB/SusD family nutrient uptake outer membrane protein n=1 Tax=Empedobacter falsenii TaxID=343874 RepID=UPI001C8EF6F6|nr:RagB/SusD family nutrient uptake outer membrane protein [Empedobacter falsenii]MBY0067843.1 RagB/SusD family nutrient uptake outer membrane protein [Empedobacter falsenii]
MKKNILILSLLACALGFTSCSDEDIDQRPYDQTEFADYYKTESDFTTAINGVYKGFAQVGYYYGPSNASDIISIGDIMADNVILNQQGRGAAQRAHTWSYNSNSVPTDIYSTSYNIISRANLVLANVDNLQDGDFKNNIIAQAKAVRALAHFEVARTYAEIPTQAAGASSTVGIAYADKYDAKAELKRDATIGESYDKIIADLEAAIPYLDNSADNTAKMNQYSAKALLGKVYLYKGDYKKVIEYTKPVVDAVAPATQAQLANLWTSNNSAGVLFEIPFLNNDDPTIGTNYSQGSSDKDIIIEYSVDKAFYNLYDANTEPERVKAYFKVFNPANDDNQATIAVNKYINGAVKLGLNNGRYLRVEEAILNLAEAQYLSGDQGAALITLNKLRDVRYSTYTGGETGAAIFDAIQLERRKELAFENGDRWFTLKRLQGVTGISSAYTSGIQRSGNGYLANGSGVPSSVQTLKVGAKEWQLPIPQTVLNKNKNMTQTPGY